MKYAVKKAAIVLLVAIGAGTAGAVAYGIWFLHGLSRYL